MRELFSILCIRVNLRMKVSYKRSRRGDPECDLSPIATEGGLRTLLKVTHPNWNQGPFDGLTPIIQRRPEPFTTSLMCPRCTETECLPHRMHKPLVYKPIFSHLHLEWAGRRTIPVASHRIEIEHPSKPCGGDCTLRHQLVSPSTYVYPGPTHWNIFRSHLNGQIYWLTNCEISLSTALSVQILATLVSS